MRLLEFSTDVSLVRKSTGGRALISLIMLAVPIITVVVFLLTRGSWWPYGVFAVVVVLGAPLNVTLGVLNFRAYRAPAHLRADLRRARVVRPLAWARFGVALIVAAVVALTLATSGAPVGAFLVLLVLFALEALVGAVLASSTVTSLRRLLALVPH